MGGCCGGDLPFTLIKKEKIMIEIKETTPTWTFKKQLENQVGKLSKR